MKIVALIVIGVTTLGGLWIINQSISHGNPWYWTLCEVIIFLLGITTLQTVATHEPGGPRNPESGMLAKKSSGTGCESN